MTPRVIPTLLLDRGKLVKTRRFRNSVYIGDPINTSRLFNDMEVDELVFLDISRGNDTSIDYSLLADLASECFMPLAYGGKIRNPDQARKIIGLGFEKIILNTLCASDPSLVREIVKDLGSQSVVGSVDVRHSIFRRGKLKLRSGIKADTHSVLDYCLKIQEIGCGEILLTSVANEGMMDGYDLDLIRSISDELTIPIIASGGAATLEHLRAAVFLGGASAVAVGSMSVFQAKGKGILINYPERVELENIFSNE